MRTRDSVAFVTGANRGIGLAFVQALLAAGARKVYAAARHPERITLEGVHRVRLDVQRFQSRRLGLDQLATDRFARARYTSVGSARRSGRHRYGESASLFQRSSPQR
jgi:NAD(P)-dependent dehydrogenase (short-subunit alcohol dehydrogenase family)